jgi:predicted metal-dependent hydrolase
MELAHQLEPTHNERFQALMDRALPQWHLIRNEISRTHYGRNNREALVFISFFLR